MNVINVWLGLPTSKKIMSLLSVIATLAALALLARTALKPKLDLLYSGLDPASAGEIVAKLEGMDVAYDVKGQAIYADSRRRDALRLELARDGLPRQSVVGYELFDDMNSFNMTSEMFDTAYWRAKEGELARTILAMPSVRSARVHLGTGKSRGFARSPSVTSASVTITSPGGITDQQVKAMQFLTALAVSGLNPEDVAIIDTSRGVLAGPGIGPADMGSQGDEIERASKIKDEILSLMEARVGLGNARVSVSLEMDRKHETTAERRFDPDGRVLKNQTSSEVSQNSTGTSSNVTVASNLPEGEAGGGQSTSDRSETTETVSYEISEIVTNTEILPGSIRRMTIAILVNDVASVNDEGETVFDPRPDDELTALQELAASAAGLDTARGDAITIKSFPFNRPEGEAMIEPPGLMEEFLDQYLGNMIMGGILALVTLLLGMFVVRPMFKNAPAPADPELLPMSLGGSSEGMLIEGDNKVMRLPDARDDNIDEGAEPRDPIELLKYKASQHQEDAATLLADWLDDDKVKAS